jgi:hypothetical protein
VKTSDSACIVNFCKLYDAECSNLSRVEDEDDEAYKTYVEKWFVFCLIWSVGGTVQ